jgi:hypothetical protein
MDRQSMLVGIVVGIMFGVTYEKFARARRDLISSKRFTGNVRRAYRRHHIPRMLAIGFFCACGAVVAVRVLLGVEG